MEPSVNHQHLHSLPHNGIPRPHEVSPPISSSEATAGTVLHIHGRLRLQEPLDHGIVAKLSCLVQRCFASGAAARAQATDRTQRKEVEKKSEKILGASKVEVLAFVATQKSSLNFRNIVVLKMFWWHQVGWKNCCLWILAVKMTWIINQNIYSNSGAKSDPKVFISSYFYKAN